MIDSSHRARNKESPGKPTHTTHMVLLTLSLFIIGSVAFNVLMLWIYDAGPNIDTMLTYHRNHTSSSFYDLLTMLVNQDQAPLPQVFFYCLHRLGFVRVEALQLSSALFCLAGILWLLRHDLNLDPHYQRLTHSKRLIAYTLSALAFILTPSLSAVMTWGRYSIILGWAWYAVWVLEQRVVSMQHGEACIKKHDSMMLGIILGFGCLISYTWGVVLIASSLSLFYSRQSLSPQVRKYIVVSLIPGLLTTCLWFAYAGDTHWKLIALRTHASTGGLFKTIGKLYHLLTYPFVGLVMFPGPVGIITLLGSSVIAYALYLFLHKQRHYIAPLCSHYFTPILLYIITTANSGYGMLGPSLIILSSGLKGILQLPAQRAKHMTALGFVVICLSMTVNLRGDDAMSTGMHANKSRQAVSMSIHHLKNMNALNQHTMMIVSDESTRYLIDQHPEIKHHFLIETAPRFAPNVAALMQFGYAQDDLTHEINRIIAITMLPSELDYVQSWLQDNGFQPTALHQKVGLFSPWVTRVTRCQSDAQYTISEWVRNEYTAHGQSILKTKRLEHLRSHSA